MSDFFTPLERTLFGPLSADGCLLFDVLAKIGFVMMVVTALLTVLLVLLGSKMDMIGSFTMTLLLYFVMYLVNRLLHSMCMRTLPSHQEGMIDGPPPSQDNTDFSTADISRLHGVLGNLGKEDQVLAKAQQTAPDPATVTLMPTPVPTKTVTPNPTPTSTKTSASSLLPTGFISGASQLTDAFPHVTATLGPTTSAPPAPTPTKTTTAAATATPAPTTAGPTTTTTTTPPVQPTYTSSPATHCTFHAVANTNLEAAFSSLQVYDISGASLNIQREINKRNLYIQRLQPGTSDQVRTFNTDLVNKLTAITKDLQSATPHVGDNMATLCQLPLTPP